ncbi:Sedoheptulokinase [Phytophthora palmivora]|uniref:Sedoheptulokinase n=1 Tax=Phytophthora palmivora TaxID=4796 RepID=A0A2P4WZB2_9STRA|nr:Sedoheptulokinase [Phytophthora palmivora]
MPSTSRTSKHRTYTILEKRKAHVLALDIDWIRQSDAIFDFKGMQTSKTLKCQGRKEMVPFAHGLLTFMKDMRRDEETLCTTMMLEYIKTNHRCWYNNYVTDK